jgi:hypothetical protein
VNGGFSLAANTTGTTTFGGVVGGTTALTSLATNAGGTTAINGGAITTTEAAGQVYGDAVTLGANTTLDTGSGLITFANTLDGARSLNLSAGTGNVTFTGSVGGLTRLGAISIATAANVTANTITAASISQAAGSGTTSLNGAVNTNTGAGVALTGTNLAVNAGITTTNDGVVTFDQSGTITIAAAGDIAADGAASLTGRAGIVTAGDVTTTNDDVTFDSPTTLAGPVAVNTGSGAGAITFADTLDGAQTLALAAGTGSLNFNAAVGAVTPLAGIAIASASSVTAGDTIALDGTPNLATDGLTIAENVNNVSVTSVGSEIRKFSGRGLVLAGGSTGSTLSGFTIAENAAEGVVFGAGSYAGTALEASTVEENGGAGMVLAAAGSGVTGLTLGGDAAAGAGITVRANGDSGVRFEAGDYAGTSIQGSTITKNAGDGILLATGVNGSSPSSLVADAVTNLLVGASTAFGNLITANGFNGILAAAADLSGTVIAGNAITDNGDQTTHVGDGILILGAGLLVGSASGSAVANPGANTISGNAANGIRIVGAQANANAILSNSIFLNGYVDGDQVIGEGIALEGGANDSSAAPTVLSAARRGNIVFVNVFVPGPGSFTLQVFANSAADARGLSPADANGFEGRTPVAGITVNGQTNTVVEVPADLVENDSWITAATTQLDGTTPTNTSPFSAGNRVVLAPATVPTGTATAHGRGIAALPGGRLYSAKTGSILVNVGDSSSPPPSVATTSVTDDDERPTIEVPLTDVYSPRFAASFLGGVQVTTADVDQDGFDDLITVPAGVPAWMTPQAAAQYRRTFAGDLARVGIFSGNPDGVWRSAWFSAPAIPSLKSGTVHVTAVNLEGTTLPEIVLAGGAQQTGVAAFQNQAAAGARPAFSTTPVKRITGIAGAVTGLAGGVFSAAGGRVVVASRAPAGTRLTVLQPSAGTAFAKQVTYAAKAAYTPGGKIAAADIFRAGATLAVGDFDGGADSNDYVDLVVGAGPGGWSNFRVVTGDKLLSGSQAVVDWELRGRGDFGAPRAFSADADPYSSNGRLTLRAADTNEDATAEVFASIGSSNQTSLLVNASAVRTSLSTQGDLLRRLAFTSASSADQPGEWTPLENTFVVKQTTVPRKGTRFTLRNGVTLG